VCPYLSAIVGDPSSILSGNTTLFRSSASPFYTNVCFADEWSSSLFSSWPISTITYAAILSDDPAIFELRWDRPSLPTVRPLVSKLLFYWIAIKLRWVFSFWDNYGFKDRDFSFIYRSVGASLILLSPSWWSMRVVASRLSHVWCTSIVSRRFCWFWRWFWSRDWDLSSVPQVAGFKPLSVIARDVEILELRSIFWFAPSFCFNSLS